MRQKLFDSLDKYSTIILVGGGTGGHIQPILNIIPHFKDTKHLIWIGGKNSNEAGEASDSGVAFHSIVTIKLATTKSLKILLYPFVLLLGVFQARTILANLRKSKKTPRGKLPICVFSKGGPGSVAVSIAAWSLSIPLFIHESDTIPGKSHRIIARFASKIFLGFESAKKYFDESKCEFVGQILSDVFEGGSLDKPLSIKGWKTTKKHILVICGSQGSQAIYEAILEQFLEDNDYEWIISLGKLNREMKGVLDTMKDVTAIEWISQNDIAQLLKDTDLTITRGSATTLAEIEAFQVHKIIIPLPYAANNHQYWNAREYEKNGDILLEQSHLIHLKTIIEAQLGQNLPHGNT